MIDHRISLSVVIPCYSISSTLIKKLFSLTNKFNCEYLLVTSSKSDNYNLSRILHKNVKIIYSDIGSSKTRNDGFNKANGEYIAYIDDDAVADPDWIKNILKFIKSHPDVAAFGGSYTSLNQAAIPSWIPKEVTTHVYPGSVARPLKWGYEWLTGTNMIYKRKILEELGGFDENLGVKGNKRGYGEETELQIRLHNAGYAIWYDPDIKVKHEFAQRKQNLWYLLVDQYQLGRDSSYIFKNLKISHKNETATHQLNKLIESGLHPLTRLYYSLGPLFYLTGVVRSKLS